jgi:hypothetical protein
MATKAVINGSVDKGAHPQKPSVNPKIERKKKGRPF